VLEEEKDVVDVFDGWRFVPGARGRARGGAGGRAGGRASAGARAARGGRQDVVERNEQVEGRGWVGPGNVDVLWVNVLRGNGFGITFG
jgi:hypothetical protein